MHHPDALQRIGFQEYPVTDRTGQQQGIAAAGTDDFHILADQRLCSLLQAGHYQRTSAAQPAFRIHQLVIDPGGFEERFGRPPDPGGQRGHATGEIQDLGRLCAYGRLHGSRVDGRVIRRQGVGPKFPLGQSQFRALDAYLADSRTFTA